MDKLNLIEMWRNLPMFVKIIVSIILGGCVVFLGSCGLEWWKYYPQDNVVEEVVEEVIKDKTGMDIDLTPSSPEK